MSTTTLSMDDIRQLIQIRCTERCLIYTPSSGVIKMSPGVYLFEAYDPGQRRLKRFKGVHKGNHLHIEDY